MVNQSAARKIPGIDQETDFGARIDENRKEGEQYIAQLEAAANMARAAHNDDQQEMTEMERAAKGDIEKALAEAGIKKEGGSIAIEDLTWKAPEADAEVKARKRWTDHLTKANAKTFAISAGSSFALSTAIRYSVFGIGAFAGLTSAAPIAAAAVLPVVAATLVGASRGYLKYRDERNQQIAAGGLVTASLKSHLLSSTFLGFSGGAVAQAIINNLIPAPAVATTVLGAAAGYLSYRRERKHNSDASFKKHVFTGAAAGFAGGMALDQIMEIPAVQEGLQKLGAAISSIPGADAVKANASKAFEATAGFAASAKQSLLGFASKTKSFFGFKSPEIKAEAPVIKPSAEQTVAASVTGSEVTTPAAEIKTPEVVVPTVESQLPSVEDMQKNMEESFKAVDQLNSSAAPVTAATPEITVELPSAFDQQVNLEESFKQFELKQDPDVMDAVKARAAALHDSLVNADSAPVEIQPVDVQPVVTAPVFTDHAVKKGESLWKIAQSTFGLKKSEEIADAVKQIREINGMSVRQGNNISIGQVIKLPETLGGAKVVPQADVVVTAKKIPLPVPRPDFESAAAADTVKLEKVPVPTPRPVFPEDTGVTSKEVVTEKPVVKEVTTQKPVIKKDLTVTPEKDTLPKARPQTVVRREQVSMGALVCTAGFNSQNVQILLECEGPDVKKMNIGSTFDFPVRPVMMPK